MNVWRVLYAAGVMVYRFRRHPEYDHVYVEHDHWYFVLNVNFATPYSRGYLCTMSCNYPGMFHVPGAQHLTGLDDNGITAGLFNS